MAPYETLLYEATEGVATLTFNRPERANAFNETMQHETIDALKQIARDNAIRAVVVTGAGKAFSSGQDVQEIGAIIAAGEQRSIGDHLRRSYNDIVTRMRTLEKPIVGAINGAAVGAGGSIALACDLRVCAASGNFVFAGFLNIGLIPDGGSTFFLPRLVGMSRAFELAILADSHHRIDAQQALSLGLVTKVVPDDQLTAEVGALARRLAQMPTRAIGLTKRALNRSWANTLDESLELEAHLQSVSGASEDFKEGVAAFLEKRTPTFRGV